MKNNFKFNLGCGWRNFGPEWIHIDGGDYEHLDSYDITDLSQYPDECADEIYASHVIEYFDYHQIIPILKEWKRVLKPGGELRLAVPDFEVMNILYHNGKVQLKDIIGPLYGRMPMGKDTIYHRTTYDYETLNGILNDAGFITIGRYDWRHYEIHRKNDDHSQAYLCPKGDKDKGILISLNVRAVK